MEPSVYTAECDLGRGVFAKRDLAEGEHILVIEGKIISFEDTLQKQATEANPIQVGHDRYIDVVPPGMYLNHSCAPNAGIVDDRILVALCDIAAGTEVRIDYSTTMQENSWTMICLCGNASCRGIVRDFRLLPASLQERYLSWGIVQNFIRRTHAHSSLVRRNETDGIPAIGH